MTNHQANRLRKATSETSERESEDIIRRLEQFPIEALEAALRILTVQKNSPHSSRKSGASSS